MFQWSIVLCGLFTFHFLSLLLITLSFITLTAHISAQRNNSRKLPIATVIISRNETNLVLTKKRTAISDGCLCKVIWMTLIASNFIRLAFFNVVFFIEVNLHDVMLHYKISIRDYLICFIQRIVGSLFREHLFLS